MGPPRLGLIPQGQLSAARGRMVCAPTYAALQEHAVGPPGLDLIPQGRLSAARGRMVCAPTYGAPQGARRGPAWFGFDSAGAAISCPRAHDMRPYIYGPARSTPWARPVWV